jgi:hypothetical protein
MRRAQVWSVDFAMSLVIFIAASAIAYTMIANTLGEDEFAQVSDQAITAADMLAGEGYPLYWSNETVIRAGLVSDGHLSLRKATELAKAPAPQLRTQLRITDNAYIYFTNASNATVAVFSQCGVGMTSVNSTARNQSLSVLGFSTGSWGVVSGANITASSPAALANLSRSDVIVLEGNISATFAGNFSTQQAQLWIEDAARRGVTIFVIGDPGFSLLGIKVNVTPVTSIAVQGQAGLPLGFATNDAVTVASNLSTIEIPSSAHVQNFTTIGLSNLGKVAYASWLYDDALVWYVASGSGSATSGTTAAILSGAINRSVVVSRPVCDNLTLPSAKQVATHARTIVYHDQLLTMHVVTWRS